MPVDTPEDADVECMPLAERRTRRQNRQLPLRYWDVLPETLPLLPPPPIQGYTLLIPECSLY
jgi:hypothetical protein